MYLRLNKHVTPHSKPEVIQENDNDFNRACLKMAIKNLGH